MERSHARYEPYYEGYGTQKGGNCSHVRTLVGIGARDLSCRADPYRTLYPFSRDLFLLVELGWHLAIRYHDFV